MTSWPVKKHQLSPPPLSELIPIISSSLEKNFKHASVTLASCPDLRESPFNLAGAGLSGNESIADIGGPPYLHPFPQFEKTYSLLDMMGVMGLSAEGGGFVLGAGAGPFKFVGVNSELMPNLSISKGEVKNLTHYAKIDEGGKCFSGPVTMGPGSEGNTDFALMANLFGCEGLPGEVVKITASDRTGKLDFISAIKDGLGSYYGDRTVSMGGVFLIKQGKANLHVMPDFSTEPLVGPQDVLKWLRFFEMNAPLVCLTTFHSFDPGLDLRIEHTHCFSPDEHGEGGHYHGDTTPEEVVYEAYLNTARFVYRIDQPPVS